MSSPEWIAEIDPVLHRAIADALPEKWRDDWLSFGDPRPVRDALLSPRTVKCETCGGYGVVDETENFRPPMQPVEDWNPSGFMRCPDCSDGVRVLPALAVLRDELIPILAPNDDGEAGSFYGASGKLRSYSRSQTSRIIGYRLPEGSAP